MAANPEIHEEKGMRGIGNGDDLSSSKLAY